MLAPRIMSAPDALVKDYTKKRWIILALLSVEIETVVTTQYPLETTREALQALLSSCESSTGKAQCGKYGNLLSMKKNFVKSTLLLKVVLSRNFCQKSMRRGNFCNFHTVFRRSTGRQIILDAQCRNL